MKTIDHDPNEFSDKRGTWWPAWLMVALSWAGYLAYHPFDWWSLSLGGFTVGLLVAWSIDVTGGKVPESWRSKPPRG